MATEPETIERAISRVDQILEIADSLGPRYREQVAQVHPDQRLSALNLLHYLALRHDDLQDLQADLGRLGLSRLGRAEAHVMASLLAVRRALCSLQGGGSEPVEPGLTFQEGRSRLEQHAARLLGPLEGHSNAGIMVTLPDEAGDDEALVREMVEAGATCARINCAQGDPEIWTRMIATARRVSDTLQRPFRVFMDLSGPRLRTGAMVPGPRLLRLRPRKDERGRIISALRVAFRPEGDLEAVSSSVPVKEGDRDEEPSVPVPKAFFQGMKPGHRVRVTDTRDRTCKLEVVEVTSTAAYVLCPSSLYLETGRPLTLLDDAGSEVAWGEVGTLFPREQAILLHVGETLLLHRDPRPGEPTRFDQDGVLAAPAHISCTFPEVLDDVRVGQPVLFDEGKIRTVVRKMSSEGVLLEVTWTHKRGGTRLRANKGINLPKSHLRLKGLTDKDLEDLRFVAAHADGVNVSFLNDSDDVEDLCDCLDACGGDELGVILKIETRRGFRNLPGILLAALERPNVGVMIARGDMAVEAGWIHMPQIQEEIMCLCEAAHVPVIWATQVLEGLAKKGQPTRAEITDAAIAERAECVMLNKGPYILEAIRTLDHILRSVKRYQAKKAPLLGQLELAEPDPTEVGRAVGTRVSRFRVQPPGGK